MQLTTPLFKHILLLDMTHVLADIGTWPIKFFGDIDEHLDIRSARTLLFYQFFFLLFVFFLLFELNFDLFSISFARNFLP